MPEVTLNDGTTLIASAKSSGDTLRIWIRSENDPFNSVEGLRDLLSIPGITEKIVYKFEGETTTFSGFTHLASVKMSDGVHVSATLTREAENV